MPASSATTTVLESRATRLRCRCRRTAPRSGGAARPGVACSSPSARGWRRRARGTESGRRRPRRPASAKRPLVDLVGGDFEEVAALADGDLADEVALLVDLGVGLGDDRGLFLVGGEVVDLVGDAAVPSTMRYGVSMKPNSLTRA